MGVSFNQKKTRKCLKTLFPWHTSFWPSFCTSFIYKLLCYVFSIYKNLPSIDRQSVSLISLSYSPYALLVTTPFLLQILQTDGRGWVLKGYKCYWIKMQIEPFCTQQTIPIFSSSPHVLCKKVSLSKAINPMLIFNYFPWKIWKVSIKWSAPKNFKLALDRNMSPHQFAISNFLSPNISKIDNFQWERKCWTLRLLKVFVSKLVFVFVAMWIFKLVCFLFFLQTDIIS